MKFKRKRLTYNEWVKYIHDYQLNKLNKMDKVENERLHNFLIDDLQKLEKNVNEIIENVYASGKGRQFADDIENIDNFFSYWKQHLKGLLTTKN